MALNSYILSRVLQATDGGLLSLSSPTTLIGGNFDEDHLDGQAIGFTFEFNGSPYTTINVDVNGWAALSGTPSSRPSNAAFNDLAATILLAPWWDDLGTYGNPTGNVKTQLLGSAPNRKRVVQWDVTHASTSGISHFDKLVFQLVLCETSNKIEFRYADFATTGTPNRASYSATCGVKVDTTGGQSGNMRDFFGTTGSPAGSQGPARTNLIVRNDGLTTIDWPGNASNGAGVGGAYNFHFEPGSGVLRPRWRDRVKAMKSQFLSSEDLVLAVPAFRNETTGALIDGTDTCTFTYRKPDNTTATVAGTWDSTLKLWKATIAAAGYAQGTWYVMAASNDATAHPQWLVLTWGDAAPAAAVTAAAQATTAATQATTAATQATGANTQATTAATQSTTAATQATLARKAAINRLKVDTTTKQQTLFDDDGTTPLKTWNLKDETGAATATRIFERGAPA